MEITIRKIADAISAHYVDEEIAKKVAKSLEDFMHSPAWERYQNTLNLPRLLWNLNCIITSVADDGHFYVRSTYFQNYNRPHLSGIERYTQHYIKIREFVNLIDEQTRMQYIKVFAQIQDPFIIDLRDCPGGSPETAYFILSHLFPDDTPLFKLYTRNKEPRLFKACSVLPFYETFNTVKKYTGRVSVLVNGNSASAAESLTFVIKNRKRGKIYGSRTATHAHIEMSLQVDNIIVHIPFAKTIDPDTGKDWEGHGIVPDYDVTSKEYIHLIYNELADNYLTPVVNATQQVKDPAVTSVANSNPFMPTVSGATISHFHI